MMALSRYPSIAIYLLLFCLSVSGFTTTTTTIKRQLTAVPPTTPSSRTRANTSTRRFIKDPDAPDNDNDNASTTRIPIVTETTPTTTTTTPNSPPSSSHTMKHPLNPYIEFQNEAYFDGTKPDSSWTLAWNNFIRQGTSLLQQGLERIGVAKVDELRPPACLNLRLSNKAVTETEDRRLASGAGIEGGAHPVSQVLYDVGCLLLDRLFDERPIQRFWFLETIARIPYFSYVSMLHLYESFGWFRAVELRKVHAAEDWNELHHLLIMESLGGNSQWSDRFLGYHVALVYYWFLVAVYLGSPRIAYQFMELLEAHAVDTYTTFVAENREQLRRLPPPSVATDYYKFGDLYLFDDFQTTRKPGTRRPPCATLLDVFENIAIDEGEHVKTMQACQDYAQFGTEVVSPHLKFRDENYDMSSNGDDEHGSTITNIGIRSGDGTSSRNSVEETEARRKLWKEWSEMINEENDSNDENYGKNGAK